MAPQLRERPKAKNIVLFEHILKKLGYEDLGVIDLLVKGVPLVGMQKAPGGYRPLVVTQGELEASALWRRKSVMGAKSDLAPPDEEELAAAAQKEVGLGFLEGPFTESQLDSFYGHQKWLLNPRFALHQGLNKVRVIDDAKASSLNTAYSSTFKLQLQDNDYIAAMIRAAMMEQQRQGVSDTWLGRTLDLSKAYKQLAIMPDHAHLAVVGFPVANKAGRIEKICELLEEIEKRGIVTGAQAAEVQGLLNFACQIMYYLFEGNTGKQTHIPTLPLCMAPAEADPADYRPEADVERLARYFAQRYGGDDSLLEARKALDPEVSFDLPAFEQALKKWGVKVDNAVELFSHIDVDFSGSISVEERCPALLNVLGSPVEEITRREHQRQRQEVKRIFEGLARSIVEKFGSIEDAFAKYGLHGTDSSLSLAQLGNLAKRLDIELEPGVLQRVFNEIDEDNTKSISVQELQKALMYHIVGFVVVEVANFLEQKPGGIVEAFGEFIAPGSVPKVAPPVLPGAPRVPTPPRLPVGEEGVSEEKFLKVLRQLKALRWEIKAWLEQASQMEEATLVTEKWARLARSGESKTQLRDYVSVLETLIKSKRANIEECALRCRRELRLRLERNGVAEAPRIPAGERHLIDSSASPSKLAPVPGRKLHAAVAPAASPVAHSPAASPASLRPDDTMHSEHRTMQAERLLQAAAHGRPTAVQRCLTSRADINAVAWSGVTALMCAARHGRLEVAQLLLESSADPVRTDMLGRTALDHARRQPAHVQEWLRGHRVLGRQEFERMVQASLVSSPKDGANGANGLPIDPPAASERRH
eukprot:g16992.t2